MTDAELVPSNGSSNRATISAWPAWKRHQLLRDLAAGTKTQRALATEYGVNYDTLRWFKMQNKQQVAAIAADLSNKFAGLWIADKERRIAEMQGDCERVADAGDVTAAEAARTRAQLFRAVSEELGQLPGRVAVIVNPVIHVIEGADIEDLK